MLTSIKVLTFFCSLETKPSWALVRDGELFRCSPVFQGVYVWWYSWPSMTMIINYHQLSSIIINYPTYIQHISNIYPTSIQHISNISNVPVLGACTQMHPVLPKIGCLAGAARRPPQVSAEQCALGDADAKDREKDDEMMSGARRVGNDGLVVSNCTTMVSKLP